MRNFMLLAAAASATVMTAGMVHAQGNIVKVDGSSTVFPITEAMAEEFQAGGGVPVTVGISGTGGGFKKFCRGETDISDASRPIKKSEMENCEAEGVEYIELPVALDALSVIVNPNNNFVECFKVSELKTMWEPDAQGKVTKWNQVNPAWPDADIGLFGAGTDSGTYDYFQEAVAGGKGTRGDFTATEDDNITIQGVAGDQNAIGFLGLAYALENVGKVKTVAIENASGTCVQPAVETAKDGSYNPLGRPIFIYVNKKSADEKKYVADFVDFYMNPANAEKLIAEVGYMPMPAEAYTALGEKFKRRETGTYFKGEAKIGVTIDELTKISEQ